MSRLKERVFGLRGSALIELTLFFGIALAIDFLFFDGNRFASVSPHPFWIIILLITVQYGTAEGLLACLIATYALLFNNLPQQTLDQDIYQYLFHVARVPLLWMVVSVLVGELRVRQIRERSALRDELSESRHREKTMAQAYHRLRKLSDSLEIKVAGQMNTFTTLFRAAKAMDKLEPDEVLLGVNEMVRSLMNPSKFSVFILKGDRLEISIENGWNADDHFEQSFGSDSSIFEEVISRQRTLCAANKQDEAKIKQQGLLAGPLVERQTGKVFGMVKIEELGFLDFNLSSIHTFQILCEWIATTYSNALRFESAVSSSLVSQETQLFSYGFFSRQRGFLVDVARRIGFDLSMVVIRLRNVADLNEEQTKIVPHILNRVVRKALRKTDMAFDYNRSGYEYAVVLPATPIQHAPIVAEKISKALQDELDSEAMSVGFSVTVQALYKEDNEKRLLSRAEFMSRLEFLVDLERRLHFEITLLAFRMADFETLSPRQRGRAGGVLRTTFRHFAQDNDSKFAYQRSQSEMVLLLPGLSVDEALEVGGRLRGSIDPQVERLGTHLEFTVQALPQSGNTLQAVGEGAA